MPFDNPPQPRREIILLRAAKDRINDPDRWSKGCWVNSESICAMQAVRNACKGHSNAKRSFMATKLARLLAHELPTRYRVCFFLSATSRVAIYNDRKSTSHQMMMELFDSAITRLEFESV